MNLLLFCLVKKEFLFFSENPASKVGVIISTVVFKILEEYA